MRVPALHGTMSARGVSNKRERGLMEVERIEGSDGRIEMYSYEWDMSGRQAKKVNRRLLGHEQPIQTGDQESVEREAICWSYGRTLGNIAVSNEELLGRFPASEGDDAILECDIVRAGKMRNGKERWWCRTHQRHWGTKADISDSSANGALRCSNHGQPMSYVIDPMHLDIADHAEVGIWCSMPPAITHNGPGPSRRPKIHVHVRDVPGEKKVTDEDFRAFSLRYNANDNLSSGVKRSPRCISRLPRRLSSYSLSSRDARWGASTARTAATRISIWETSRERHTRSTCVVTAVATTPGASRKSYQPAQAAARPVQSRQSVRRRGQGDQSRRLRGIAVPGVGFHPRCPVDCRTSAGARYPRPRVPER